MKKSELTKAKEKLWKLMRKITEKRFPDSKCYTCGRGPLEGSNRQLGHFITSSTCSTEMRYDLDNVRWQCYDCNINKNGNWVAFYKALQRDNGEQWVKDLIERNELGKGAKYGLYWINQRIAEYEELL